MSPTYIKFSKMIRDTSSCKHKNGHVKETCAICMQKCTNCHCDSCLSFGCQCNYCNFARNCNNFNNNNNIINEIIIEIQTNINFFNYEYNVYDYIKVKCYGGVKEYIEVQNYIENFINIYLAFDISKLTYEQKKLYTQYLQKINKIKILKQENIYFKSLMDKYSAEFTIFV